MPRILPLPLFQDPAGPTFGEGSHLPLDPPKPAYGSHPSKYQHATNLSILQEHMAHFVRHTWSCVYAKMPLNCVLYICSAIYFLFHFAPTFFVHMWTSPNKVSGPQCPYILLRYTVLVRFIFCTTILYTPCNSELVGFQSKIIYFTSLLYITFRWIAGSYFLQVFLFPRG